MNDLIKFAGMFLQALGGIFLIIQFLDYIKITNVENLKYFGILILVSAFLIAILSFILKKLSEINYKISQNFRRIDKELHPFLVPERDFKEAEEIIEQWNTSTLSNLSSLPTKIDCENFLTDAREYNDKLNSYIESDKQFYVIDLHVENTSNNFDEFVHFNFKIQNNNEQEYELFKGLNEFLNRPYLRDSKDNKLILTFKELTSVKPSSSQEFLVVTDDSIYFEFTKFHGKSNNIVFLYGEPILITSEPIITFDVSVISKIKSFWQNRKFKVDLKSVISAKEYHKNILKQGD